MIQMINKFESYSTSSGYVEVTNMGGFISSFNVSYTLNGQYFNKESGIFSLFFSRTINIPANATNIHVLVVIANGLGQWTPVYNNNLDNPGTIRLKLYGTIFSPQADILYDSNPPKYSISVKNIAGFTTTYILSYSYNGKKYSINSGNFTLGMIRNINIPKLAKNVSVIVIAVLDSALPDQRIIYSKNFSSALNIKLKISGTSINPKIDEQISSNSIGENSLDFNIPVVKISKTPSKTQATLGKTITFNITIFNSASSTVKMLVLSEGLPNEATFIKNSFTLNGISMNSNYLPTLGVRLDDLAVNDTIKLTYSILFNSIPYQNPVEDKPMLNYNYVDSNGKTQTTSVLGTVIPLTIINNIGTTPPNLPCMCCGSCCCCCQSK